MVLFQNDVKRSPLEKYFTSISIDLPLSTPRVFYRCHMTRSKHLPSGLSYHDAIINAKPNKIEITRVSIFSTNHSQTSFVVLN